MRRIVSGRIKRRRVIIIGVVAGGKDIQHTRPPQRIQSVFGSLVITTGFVATAVGIAGHAEIDAAILQDPQLIVSVDQHHGS